MNCELFKGITINGIRPRCAPAVARIEHRHVGATALCQHHLDAWFDNADDDDSLEPAAWSWLPGRRPEQLAPA